MPELHIPALPAHRGQRLGNEEYLADFRARDAAIRNGTSWKLERLQHFEEVGSPSLGSSPPACTPSSTGPTNSAS